MQYLRVMRGSLYGSHVVMIATKGSPYLHKLDPVIRRLYESGIIQHWEGSILHQFPSGRLQIAVVQSAVNSKDKAPVQLQVQHLHGAFMLLSIGLSIACISFMFELTVNKFRRK